MATTPVDSGGTQRAPSPMVAVPGAREAPVILGTGIGMSMPKMECKIKTCAVPPTAILSVPGETTVFLSDLWTGTRVAMVVRSAVWPAYSGVAVRRHSHRSVAARRLPLTPRWVARRIARVVPIATLASPEVLMRRAGAR